MFKPYELVQIKYQHKNDDSSTTRVIIPTFVPSAAMKAIDVTRLSEEERLELQGLLRDYAAYFEAAVKRVFSFEDWISHTTGLSEDAIPEVKWRTFLLENTERID